MSNTLTSDTQIYGAARRRDGSASLLFDPGTEWTVPMYSCASASKALIKTVSFRYNGTEGLKSLEILEMKPKVYASQEDMPLWAVENLSLKLRDANPVWGITLPEHANHPNISTARQEYLYLPGLSPQGAGVPTNVGEFLAGVDFYSTSMSVAYSMEDIDSNSFYGIPDYTGKSNLAMYKRWQEDSRNTTTAAQIINLIWTDISANAVVGTKSQVQSEALQNLEKRGEPQTTAQVPVTIYTRRVRFHLRYGIPAFFVLILSGLLALIGLCFILIGRATPTSMRRYLDQTSAGRLLTTFLYTNDCPPGTSRENWVRLVGQKRVNLGGLYPRAIDSTTGVPLSTGNAVGLGSSSTPGSLAYGKVDDAAISLNSLHSPQPYSPVGGGGAAQSYYNDGEVTGNSPYTYVPPGSGMLNPHLGYT